MVNQQGENEKSIQLKIADFGMAKNTTVSLAKTVCGTPYFMYVVEYFRLLKLYNTGALKFIMMKSMTWLQTFGVSVVSCVGSLQVVNLISS